jgi:hypothetical protein
VVGQSHPLHVVEGSGRERSVEATDVAPKRVMDNAHHRGVGRPVQVLGHEMSPSIGDEDRPSSARQLVAIPV